MLFYVVYIYPSACLSYSNWDTKANVLIPLIKTEPLQVKESIDEAKTDAPDESDVVADIEITFEHKPGSTTPTGKRQLPGGSSESTSFEGLCDGELSSNKLKKIIKLEKDEWTML
ncbi:unnamed protein product [Vicia faba]|uniref:Uncharacterized protein n=1 Tax=Vicia faba TaxID=3906 RepID=A0AAV0YI79_VICFA|nr:unnamed protein product [Vicia faba]